MSAPTVVLNNGIEIPQVGFGVWRVSADEAQHVVGEALDVGYRHIDTASIYGNEQGVGAAIRESRLVRDEVFVTSKVWNTDQGYDSTLRAFDATMERLGLDQLDLYLIHWPLPAQGTAGDTWRALERLYLDGRVRAIGVSNFEPGHLRALVDGAEVAPTVNQVELHPYLQQRGVRAANAQLGVATEAWSPIAKGGDLLGDPTLKLIAEKHDRTPAQVVLRWHLQNGVIVIPKTVRRERMLENFELFDFELDERDMAAIDALDRGGRVGSHPDDVS